MAIERVLLVDGLHGVHVPMVFARRCAAPAGAWIVDHLARCALLEGASEPGYWEAWSGVLRDATYTDAQGRVWTLEQDGDLFAVTGDDDEREGV